MELTWLGDGGYTLRIVPYQQPVLIYNPAAGKLRRDPQRILQRTTEALARANLRPRLAPTSGPLHATEIAEHAIAGGADLIIVLGGDGTINEALNGMVHSKATLGILPAGTANVLAMELGLGSRLGRAIDRLVGSVERRIAVGKLCNGAGIEKHFLAMGGAGLDARIVYDLNPKLKAWGGKLAYWLAGFGHITQRVGQCEVRIDDKTYRSGFVLASRVRNYGGDLEIATGASLLHDDFEVVIFEGSNPLRYAYYMLGVGVKLVQKMPGVHTVHARHVTMTGDVHLQIDGEYAGRLPGCFEIVPDAITLLIPPNYG
jgi:diacylglycerol kinase (ATP)